MIPINFYRDDEYVYYNNPNGITRKMSIADFESVMSGTGGSGDTDDFVSFDVVLDINFDTYTGSVLKGDYNTVREKITNNTPIVVGVHTKAGSSQTFTIGANYELTTTAIYFAVFVSDGSAFDTHWAWQSDGTLVTDD